MITPLGPALPLFSARERPGPRGVKKIVRLAEEGKGKPSKKHPHRQSDGSEGRWFGSQLVGGLLGATIAYLLGGVGLIAGITLSGAESDLTDLIGVAVAFVPTIWLLVCLAVALFGLLPRLNAVAWLVLTCSLVAGIFGPIVGLPAWFINASPYSNVPQIPQESLMDQRIVVMIVLAALLAIVGALGFRRRDIRA